MVEIGHFPWWPAIDIRRPCISSSEIFSTVPAFPSGEDHGFSNKPGLGLLKLAEDRGHTDLCSWHGSPRRGTASRLRFMTFDSKALAKNVIDIGLSTNNVPDCSYRGGNQQTLRRRWERPDQLIV
jgi:hypothetical protein